MYVHVNQPGVSVGLHYEDIKPITGDNLRGVLETST